MATYAKSLPMRIQARPGSKAESAYFAKSTLPGLAWPMPKAIAPGIDPAPMEDLIFHGGKVVPRMEFQNVYLGGSASWSERDLKLIDGAIQRAMQHKQLDNVMQQYFPGVRLQCEMRDSFVLDEAKPKTLTEEDIRTQVMALFDDSLIADKNLDTCLFNLILPAGAVLKLGGASSLGGLGGFHGSLHHTRGGRKRTLYYSANVFSQLRPDGTENGIVAFDEPWKNVVGTLYHEINEFRTDPDINDAIEKRDNDFLGWNTRLGREVGDQPIFKAGPNLDLVFQEVNDPPRKTSLPVQFMYSNAVHGAEGPIARPHA